MQWNIMYLNCEFYLSNHLSVHTIWQIWIQDPHHNLYHWALPHIKDTVYGYLISISTRHNLLRSLHFSSFFRYLNLFQDFMKCYANVLFYNTCLIITTILIICSFFFQGILYLESIGLLRFRRIIDSGLPGLHIGAFAAELYHRVNAFIWQLICNIMQLNYPLNFKFKHLFNEDLDN